jgi:hypothetical protein
MITVNCLGGMRREHVGIGPQLAELQTCDCPSRRAERIVASAPTRRLSQNDLPIDSNRGIRSLASLGLLHHQYFASGESATCLHSSANRSFILATGGSMSSIRDGQREHPTRAHANWRTGCVRKAWMCAWTSTSSTACTASNRPSGQPVIPVTPGWSGQRGKSLRPTPCLCSARPNMQTPIQTTVRARAPGRIGAS